ncbi:MAG: hypothetical protein AB1592_15825 [Pseudomonadota bacterium]
MAQVKSYFVAREGFLLGTYRKVGERVPLTPAQAKYFLPPHDDRLTVTAPGSPGAPAGGSGN